MTNTPSAKTKQELLDAAMNMETDALRLYALADKQDNFELAHNVRSMAQSFRDKAIAARAAAEKGK